jgi:hypothetical protein
MLENKRNLRWRMCVLGVSALVGRVKDSVEISKRDFAKTRTRIQGRPLEEVGVVERGVAVREGLEHRRVVYGYLEPTDGMIDIRTKAR